jgi:hypothetical protein
METVGGAVKPPAWSVAERIGKSIDDPNKAVGMVPLVGKPLYDRYLGGNETTAIAELKAKRTKERMAREAASPALKRERLAREAERKQRAYEAAKSLK